VTVSLSTVSRLVPGFLGLILVAVGAGDAKGQTGLRELVFTGGLSGERYEGNLPAVALPIVDSTDHAAAAVGEFGIRGEVGLHSSEAHALSLSFDGGLRQFSASGFLLRDYAPTEWVGQGQLTYAGVRDWGSLRALAGGRVRGVRDRTPTPLFIEPGYREGSLALQGFLNPRPGWGGARFYGDLEGEVSNYATLPAVPQLDLLDRNSLGVELGAEWGERGRIRVHSALRRYHYPRQGTFDPDDPFRRDRTLQAGVAWIWNGPVYSELGATGVLNRSNSRRPEYDAVSLRALLAASLPGEVGVQLFANITGKSYLEPTEFARLVPGEEADNASLFYLQVSRPISENLDGALRFGWTRAETDIGDAYFQRYGATFLLNFRPLRR